MRGSRQPVRMPKAFQSLEPEASAAFFVRAPMFQEESCRKRMDAMMSASRKKAAVPLRPKPPMVKPPTERPPTASMTMIGPMSMPPLPPTEKMLSPTPLCSPDTMLA